MFASALITRTARSIPLEHRHNFIHLVLDITAFGVLNGSAVAFLQVFATRLGATREQLGLLAAIPAMVAIAIALPSGGWLRDRSPKRMTVITAIIYRAFYLLWALLPLLLPTDQILRWLMVLVLIMSVPGTLLAISFNGLYAVALPSQHRGQVMARRQAGYAISSIVTSLGVGALLGGLPFPQGYQVVFVIGTLGGFWSCYHVWQIRPISTPDPPKLRPLRTWARPGLLRNPRSAVSSQMLRAMVQLRDWRALFRPKAHDRYFYRALLLLFLMHFSIYLTVPIHPLRYVRELGLGDNVIGVANALFYVMLFVSATQYERIEQRLGNNRTLGLALLIMSNFPLWVGLATGATHYFIASTLVGIGAAMLMGATGNYLQTIVPEENRAPYFAWYSLALNLAILTGSLLGPQLAAAVGLTAALFLGAMLRAGSGLLLWRYGSHITSDGRASQ